MLQDLFIEKREDEEIVLQLLFTFRCLFLHEELREVVLQDTGLASTVMSCTQIKNRAVAEQASELLDLISDFGGEMAQDDEEGAPPWAEQIKAFRFELHNGEWCRWICRESQGGGEASPMSGDAYGYYAEGREDESGDEEEEFAFRYGNAVDAQDLVNRDWGAAAGDFRGGMYDGELYD